MTLDSPGAGQLRSWADRLDRPSRISSGRLPSSPDLRLVACQRLFQQGAWPEQQIVRIQRGIVRFERVDQHGSRRIVGLAGPGDLLGLEAVLGCAYADDVIACTAVELSRLARPDIVRALAEQPALYFELMRGGHRAMLEARAWTAELVCGPARQRVLRLIARLARYAELERVVWLPRRHEMSAMLDLRVETVSRQISALQREGVLYLLGPWGGEVNPEALAAALATGSS